MLQLLVYCVLAHTALSNVTMTSEEIAEAYKYFEAAHAKNRLRDKKGIKPAVSIPTTDMPNSLLAVLHNINPIANIPAIKPLEIKPLLESRERSDETPNQEYRNKFSNEVDFDPEDDEISSDEKKDIDSRNFMNLLQNFLRESRVRPQENATTVKDSVSAKMEYVKKRRMLDWFTNLFGKRTTVPTSTTEANILGVIPRESADMNHNDTNVIDVLVKLNNVLEKLNQNIELELLKANKSDAYFVLKLPVKQKSQEPNYEELHYRGKREVKTNNIPIVKKSANLTKNPMLTVNPITSAKVDEASNTFKSKILSHLIDSFNEIKYKIAPLSKVKENHSSSDLYKIGYIAASVDTLEENLNSLMAELESNKNVWDEHKILEFFDKLKTSNRVLRTLMEYLGMLADKKLIYESKDLRK